MEAFVRDLRFAQRMLISRPGFTVLAVVCLALGIGASAAIFSVVNGVLLKPLPFPDPDRLVAFGSIRGKAAELGSLSAPDFVDLRAGASHADLAVYTDDAFSLRNNDAAVQLRGARISSNLFRVLGVAPMLGRSPRSRRSCRSADRKSCSATPRGSASSTAIARSSGDRFVSMRPTIRSSA